jgi:[Skp1-protein]-hydroxyproline N-acetylglucosaminyltransferase
VLTNFTISPQFDEHGILRQTGRLCKAVQDAPLSSPLWASGFSFSRSCMIEEVPYDPHLRHLFFGEEISMVAR